MTQYVDWVGMLENRLHAIFNLFKDADRIRTMLRGLSTKYAMTRDLVRELGKRHHGAVTTLVATEAEFKPSHLN